MELIRKQPNINNIFQATRDEEGLSNPVANESAGLMITQTLRHLRHLRLEVSIFEGFIVLTIAGSS